MLHEAFQAPSSHLAPGPHPIFSFYFGNAGISEYKETAAVLGKKNHSHALAIYGQFPINKR